MMNYWSTWFSRRWCRPLEDTLEIEGNWWVVFDCQPVLKREPYSTLGNILDICFFGY
jgi:hypothetical protein